MQGMKVLWLGLATSVVIAIVAGVVMTQMNPSAGSAFSTENVRLK